MFPAWLFDWSTWWRRCPWGEHLRLVLYTRHGCHLCEIAKRQLETARRRHGFILEEVDVDENPRLVEQYGSLVPVLTINGKVRFRGTLNPVLLHRLLHAEKEKGSRTDLRDP